MPFSGLQLSMESQNILSKLMVLKNVIFLVVFVHVVFPTNLVFACDKSATYNIS